jgi:hypothetical protein
MQVIRNFLKFRWRSSALSLMMHFEEHNDSLGLFDDDFELCFAQFRSGQELVVSLSIDVNGKLFRSTIQVTCDVNGAARLRDGAFLFSCLVPKRPGDRFNPKSDAVYQLCAIEGTGVTAMLQRRCCASNVKRVPVDVALKKGFHLYGTMFVPGEADSSTTVKPMGMVEIGGSGKQYSQINQLSNQIKIAYSLKRGWSR